MDIIVNIRIIFCHCLLTFMFSDAIITFKYTEHTL